MPPDPSLQRIRCLTAELDIVDPAGWQVGHSTISPSTVPKRVGWVGNRFQTILADSQRSSSPRIEQYRGVRKMDARARWLSVVPGVHHDGQLTGPSASGGGRAGTSTTGLGGTALASLAFFRADRFGRCGSPFGAPRRLDMTSRSLLHCCLAVGVPCQRGHVGSASLPNEGAALRLWRVCGRCRWSVHNTKLTSHGSGS